jgi:hypothetical protein
MSKLLVKGQEYDGFGGRAANGKPYVEVADTALKIRKGTAVSVDAQAAVVDGIGDPYRNKAGVSVVRVYLTEGSAPLRFTNPAPAPKTTPKAAVAMSSGPAVPSGRNRKAGSCERCGEWLKAGDGTLLYCHEDGGCRKHFDHSGYHVCCADKLGCDARRAVIVQEREARKAAKAALEPAVLALRQSYSHLTVLDRLPEGCTEIWGDGRMAGSETWYAAPDGVVYYVRSDYDMGPTYWRTTATAEQVEQVKVSGFWRAGLLEA